MIKKLLSIVMLFTVAGMVNAQAPKSSVIPSYSPLKKSLKYAKTPQAAKMRAATRGINVGDGQAWFGYWNPEVATPLGTALPCDYNLAIWIPYDKVAGKGATIDGIRFYQPVTKAVTNMKVWIAESLPEPDHYKDGPFLESQEVTNLVEGYNEVAFSKSYEIPEGGIYLGYSFDSEVDMSEYPEENYTTNEEYYVWLEQYYAWLGQHPEAEPFAISYGDTYYEGSMYFATKYYDDIYREYAQTPGYEDYLNYIGWNDYATYGYYLACEALIGGGKFRQNAASAADFGEKYAAINQDVTFPVTITNYGLNGLKDFTYEVAFNGTKVDEQTVTLEEPITNILGSQTMNITFNTSEQIGLQTITITITKVNGEANESETVANGSIIVLAEFAEAKPLIEEYTGTWCGWCTRGWVGLELLAEDFAGKAITVAAHNGDPMEIDEYTGVISKYVAGFPSMLINRLTDVDPFHGSSDSSYGVKKDVEAAIAASAPAGISVKAEWADDDKTKINISTESKFFYDDENPTVGIGYILVADGLKGSGRDWAQSNYYPNYADNYGDDPYLGALTQMDEYITDMTYNHVAVAGWGIENGVEGSISGALKAGEAINGTFEADLNGLLIGSDRNSDDPDDHVTVLDMIKDKDVHIVAFLINQTTGEILNADETDIAGKGETGIHTINEKTTSVAERYNISGQRIATPQKGLNIIRLTDGKAVKVVVK